jgi:1-acyl-sn-glycerol-3-phosphate acyltransferase
MATSSSAAKKPAAKKSSALAAGAARAGGERERRRSTPLLSAAIDADTAPPTRRRSASKTAAAPAPATSAASAPKALPAKKAATKPAATKAAPATKRPAAKAATKPAATKVAPATKAAAPATKAATKRAATRTAPTKVAATKSAVAQSAATDATQAPTTDAATQPVTARGKHRPRPTVRSAPVAKARSQSGERRVPRLSPKAKRAADDLAARRLRLADPVADAPRVSRVATAAATDTTPAPRLDPTSGAARVPVPMPGLDDLVQGIITAVRFAAEAAGMSPEDIERKLAAAIAYVRRRIEGDYDVDEFGYDEHFTQSVVFPLLRPIYENWFRVEVRGIENIPAEGGALIVANHSGTIAIDSIITQLAVHDETANHRIMRALGADLVFQTPFIGLFARRTGSTLAANSDAERLFEAGELVGVFPEGFKGVGKPFKERYKLQRFGRGGFVAAALKAGVPIIPTSIVGAEEIAPIIGNMNSVARIFGLPYAPITPTFPWLGPLGLIPLPSKWIIEFGTPIPTDGFGPRADEDPMLVFDLTDQVRETIQQTLYALLMQRKSVFF